MVWLGLPFRTNQKGSSTTGTHIQNASESANTNNKTHLRVKLVVGVDTLPGPGGLPRKKQKEHHAIKGR